MTGLILTKVAIVIFFCKILQSSEDFLEYYQPRPGFPKELNEWLAYVQGHRDDFRIIRNTVKRRKEEGDYYEERETGNRLLSDLEEEDSPVNDIYPHDGLVKKEKNYRNFITGQNKNRKISNGAARTRRESQNSYLEDDTVEINSRGRNGEVERSQPKYPDQFINHVKDDIDKREIQIDILNDGKLLKTIKDNNKDPKSIVLNIQNKEEHQKSFAGGQTPNKYLDSQLRLADTQDKFEDTQDKFADSQPKFTENQPKIVDTQPKFVDSQPKFADPHPKFPDSQKDFDAPVAPLNSLQRSVEIDNNANNNEAMSNYQNLFTVNENLNTDSSVARDSLAKTALMYHVTLPDPNFIVHHDHDDSNVSYNQNSFQHNNFRDMSKYWSVSEKNQLQQGIDFAQETGNLRKFQQNVPQKMNDGFEIAKTVIVEHVADKPNVEDLNKSQSKRNLQSLDGKVQLERVSFATTSIQDLPFDQLEDSMKNNLADTRQVQQNEYNPPVSDSAKTVQTNNRIVFITKKKQNEIPEKSEEQNDEQKDSAGPQKIDENINNHIAITIVEAQKNDETEESEEPEESEKSLTIETSTSIEETPATSNPEESDNENNCNKYHQSNKNAEFPVIQKNNPPETSTQENKLNMNQENQEKMCGTGQSTNEGESVRNQFKDIRVEPDHRKFHYQKDTDEREMDQKRYFSSQDSPDLIKIPLMNYGKNEKNFCHGPNCNNAQKSCQGSDCSPYKRFSRIKHKRKRGRRKHKSRRMYEDFENHQMPSYKLRQLKTVEYVYDGDQQGSEEDYASEPASSERTKHLADDSIKSVEGDYADEEDSWASKTNSSSKLIKQSDNPFANPLHPSVDQDDDDDYYDDDVEKANNTKKDGNKSNKSNFFPEDDKVNLGKRVQKKGKSHPKKSQNKDTTKSQIREPRASEDLQQLPKFVIDDQLNEENLRKRSLANQKEGEKNKFPLSSKSFFANNNPKRRDSTDGDVDILADKPPAQDGQEKSITTADGLGPDIADPNMSKTGDNSNEITDVSEATTLHGPTDECGSTQFKIGPLCASENFTKVKVTTMLNLVAESQADLGNISSSLNEQYQNLEDMLIGRLPLSIVDSVFLNMKQHPTFKQRFFKGMKKTHGPYFFRNLPEISGKESNKLIRLMSKIMNRLQWTTTCQVLPSKLRRYLKAITETRSEDRLTKTKAMEEVDFEENQNQTNFIFHSNNGVDNIEEKVRILKNMLSKFEHLPDSCKPRAEPVKEYIENHLDMLTHVMSNNMGGNKLRKIDFAETASKEPMNNDLSHHETAKRNEKNDGSDLIEQELESLGLGKHPNFRPKFDLEALVHGGNNRAQREQEDKKARKTSKRDINRETSDEYDRLLAAVKKERIKREGKKRIAEAFGKLSLEDYNGKYSDNIVKEVFENPLVYSL